MNPTDPLIIDHLRRMASNQTSVSQLVLSVLHAPFNLRHPLDVLTSFREAFGLTLAHVKPLADWLADGQLPEHAKELDRLVRPYFERSHETVD